MTTWWTDERCRRVASNDSPPEEPEMVEAARELLRLREENRKLREVLGTAERMCHALGVAIKECSIVGVP